MNPETKYKKILADIATAARPIVFVNGGTHGDEHMGQSVIALLEKETIVAGTLITNIANEEASHRNVRYIEHDVNRVAPGNVDGTYEEKVSYYLSMIAGMVDVFIDIHSTESTVKDTIIIDTLSDSKQRLIDVINPAYVLVMEVTGDAALIAHGSGGIAFEYGNDADVQSIKKVCRDIQKILVHYGMLTTRFDEEDVSETTQTFFVKKSFKKIAGYTLRNEIQNFTHVAKGDVVAVSDNNPDDTITAPEDFYPVLFSQNGYEDMYGFMGYVR